MGYVADELKKVATGPEMPTLYWRPIQRWTDKQEANPWLTSPVQDGKDFYDVDDNEYIAYDSQYVYVWVVYDCYTGSFHRVSRNGPQLDDHACEAG